MEKILITGGAGFIGSHLTKHLLDKGNEVTVLDNLFTGNQSNIYQFKDNPKFHFVLHDITQPYWGRFDTIYNLACPASPIHYQRNPIETIKTSYLGMQHVLELALKTGAKVLQASTSEIYGDPLVHPQVETYWGNVNTIGVRSCYDEGKRVAETLCSDYNREYNVDVRIVRIFNTYGPNMNPQDGRVISNFIMQALNNENITIYGDGEQTRSFQYVADLIAAFDAYMSFSQKEIYDKFEDLGWENVPVLNIGNPTENTIKELAEGILELIPESKSELVKNPLPKDDPQRRKPDITMAKQILSWEPKVKLKEGLTNTIEYFRNFKD